MITMKINAQNDEAELHRTFALSSNIVEIQKRGVSRIFG